MRIKWFSLVRITGLLLVLLYHFFQKVFPGGFIGVDIFFTFSGFLITALLIDEFARHQKIDLKGFLRRRFYRIVPPLVFMVLLVMPFTFLVRRDFIAGIGTQIAAVFGFVTNFYEMLSGGSYESQFIPHLFIHTWSLALEVHYYVLWALLAWFLGKKAKSVGQYRGYIFLSSTGLFLVTFLTFFVGALVTKNLSNVYFSSIAHVFPFFVGSALATVTGITTTSPNLTQLVKKLSLQKTLAILAGAFLVLLLLTFILPFDSVWTYLFGFLVATLAGSVMIVMTRVLHEKTPDQKEPAVITFIADTSYGVYLFHWPFYIIFSQLMTNGWASLLTTLVSFSLAALSFYIIEPTLAGREPKIFGISMDLSSFTKPLFYSAIPLTLLMFGIALFAPRVGAFDENLITEGLRQSDSKMQITRAQVDNASATSYNVSDGVTMIGDSVNLRASDYLKQVLPDIQLDALVSRNLDSGLKVYETDIANRVLLKNVVIALGTNSSNNYQELLDKFVQELPKGHRLIFVTPYDGREANDSNSVTVQTRQYELELAKKYDYVYIADWYQAAIDNPAIWAGTDNVHFGLESDGSIDVGGNLYAKVVKEAVDQANQGPVKP
ncbi:acyltransferase family protein [Streptococcus australis]|uniref:acyltransferase family protein n=1 Tax=Streptococcus australis TaxID=113107 RepID=UPI0018972FEA|nr:acyltransferase family protein [Streptococcus australis]MDB8650797.1 acyltransferase family protein [Streptococcus australis]